MGLTKIEKIIPGARWLRGYSTEFFFADLIAGITVGLTVLPQSLAYATLAGLDPQFGLYSAFVGGAVYALVGGCREVTIGPTALLALMTSQHTNLGGISGPNFAVLLCFLSGIVEFFMALLKLGSLVDLISLPVTIGFTSATALIIGASQLKGLLGLKGGSGSSNFLPTVKFVITRIHELRVSDTLLGVGSIFILLALRKLKDFKTPPSATKKRKILGAILWLTSTARNALLVLISSAVAYYAYENGQVPFILTGKVKSGLPTFSLPPFETTIMTSNGTMTDLNFTDMVSELGTSILLVPIIAVLGNVAISKAFGTVGINATWELIALSLSNIIGSFFSSIPVTGSFSRSAVNHASGVKTPIGGIYTGILVILALSILTPYFQYIPRAALSAVIISAVIFMIEYEVIKPLWRCSRRELFTVALTLILSLLIGVEIGLLSGVILDIAFVMHRTARPILSFEQCQSLSGIEYTMLKPRHSLLCFPAAEYIRNAINVTIAQFEKSPSFIVIDFRNIQELDYTAAKGLGGLKKELAERDIILILLGCNDKVKLILKTSLKSQNCYQVEDENHLDIMLQDQKINSKGELKDVIAPLLIMPSNDEDISIAQKESLRRE
ncbi:hypothetical protein PVAND_010292 [Polypedilum vanderplanki]|uniref:STAS domain-containing protein n=1 Tax=Polypedilum vanderplanki TaxID=319348 RepID=A0A9J6CFY7_POLVA|nr:hypothetical protein PVAND_010292 [Polypedilum vanderplanki]